MIELPFPDKALWPNGRPHHMAKHRAFQKHKSWAHIAMLSLLPACFKHNGEPVQLAYTVRPKTRHAIDRDNCVAAMKAYQDGIAAALGVDDSAFLTPTIEFGEPIKGGLIEVRL